MKIYITRHGETKWNKEGRMQGWQNSNLSKKGIEDAKKLGNRVKDIDFSCIYSSTLERAVDTAKYIRGSKDTKIITLDSLKEMGFGKWEGMHNNDIMELYPIEHYNFWNKPHLYNAIDGESFKELFKRAETVLNEIINKHSRENILVVSHGVFIKVLCCIIKKETLNELWNPPFIQGASLTILEVIDKEIKIISESDISHLE